MAAFLKQQFCGGAPLQGSDTMVEGRVNSKAGAGASTTRPRRVPHAPVPPIEGGRLAVRALPALRLLLRELGSGATVGLRRLLTDAAATLAQSRCASSAVRAAPDAEPGALAYSACRWQFLVNFLEQFALHTERCVCVCSINFPFCVEVTHASFTVTVPHVTTLQ